MTNSPVILVTGASGGIGSVAARECALKGARIAVHYHRNSEGAENLLAGLSGSGHRKFAADVSDADAVNTLIQAVVDDMGSLDVLVNNAGVAKVYDVTRIDYQTWQESWRYVMETNLTGPANLCFCASRVMINQGGGRIVNVSSRGAFRGEPKMPWYGASKAGLNAMGQSMAQALSPHNVFVYTVAPGFVETEMARDTLEGPEGDGIRGQSPMNRVAKPDEVGKTICFLAMEAPDFMTGCIVDVNGASYLRS